MVAPEVSPEELRARLAGASPPFLLDVREPDEITEWAFPGAVNIPLGALGERVHEVPTDRDVVVICHAGVRSATAADALMKAGWPAQNLRGGVIAWIETEPGTA
jgi:rhodanese-related sulfurtransferase